MFFASMIYLPSMLLQGQNHFPISFLQKMTQYCDCLVAKLLFELFGRSLLGSVQRFRFILANRRAAFSCRLSDTKYPLILRLLLYSRSHGNILSERKYSVAVMRSSSRQEHCSSYSHQSSCYIALIIFCLS